MATILDIFLKIIISMVLNINNNNQFFATKINYDPRYVNCTYSHELSNCTTKMPSYIVQSEFIINIKIPNPNLKDQTFNEGET